MFHFWGAAVIVALLSVWLLLAVCALLSVWVLLAVITLLVVCALLSVGALLAVWLHQKLQNMGFETSRRQSLHNIYLL